MDISHTFLTQMSKTFNNNDKNKLARNAVTSSSLENILVNREEAQQHNRIFSNFIDIETKPTNQKRSGRCWIFALCNMMRLKMIDRYNLPPEFELSCSYLFFYHKLETSNYFLSLINKFKSEPINSRMNNFILREPLSDGGNWNMILNLVNKYGVIPKSNFQESSHTENTGDIDEFLSNKLRDYAFSLRLITDSKKREKYIENCLAEIYKILVIFIGEPPTKITWEYLNNGRYKVVSDIKPKDFYLKYVRVNLNDYLLLSNNPSHPDYSNFTINNFNNMVNGVEINYINVPIGELKRLVKKSIDAKEPLWFGCDVGKYLNKTKGVLDKSLVNFKNIFDTDITLSKKNRLLYNTSDVTHAMLFRGYDNHTIQSDCKKPKKTSKKRKLTKNKSKQKGGSNNPKKCKSKLRISSNPVTKYLVENSWGKGEEDENIVMTSEYFDDYVYIVAVPKSMVSRKLISISKQKPKRLELWDPFGYLLF
jgi:bleomycin hydrolase